MRLLSLVTNLPTNRSPASRLSPIQIPFVAGGLEWLLVAALRHRRMSAFYGNLRQKPTRIDNRANNNCRAQTVGIAECRGWLAVLLEGQALQARQTHAELAPIDAACAVRAESSAVKVRLR